MIHCTDLLSPYSQRRPPARPAWCGSPGSRLGTSPRTGDPSPRHSNLNRFDSIISLFWPIISKWRRESFMNIISDCTHDLPYLTNMNVNLCKEGKLLQVIVQKHHFRLESGDPSLRHRNLNRFNLIISLIWPIGIVISERKEDFSRLSFGNMISDWRSITTP